MLKPPFYSACTDGKKFEIIDDSIHKYSSGLCLVDCVMMFVKKKCGCVAGEMNLYLKKGIFLINPKGFEGRENASCKDPNSGSSSKLNHLVPPHFGTTTFLKRFGYQITKKYENATK